MSRPHDSALTHVTGQSEFIDDRAPTAHEVFVEVYFSPIAHATIGKIDDRHARAVPGVLAVYTAKDFAHNLWGSIIQDQPLLAEKEVQFAGEAIALIVGSTRKAAALGKQSLKITLRPMPAILSIRDARTAQSWIGSARKIEKGDVSDALLQSPHRLSGDLVIRGADHFYLESQVALAYPEEQDCIEVHSSSQHPTETQHVVAHALGIPYKNVVCIVKRMGGAFGGKESQAAPFAAYAALAAHKLKRPARIVLTKDDDMIMTGKRNPFENSYEVGFDSHGKILALDAQLFSDGGAYADLSTSIMERAMLHLDNAYFIPHFRVTGQVCRTHFHPHTAFRGFGGPKGVATIEHIIERMARALNRDALDIRKINCYAPGRDSTHYGQTVENNCLPRLFETLERTSNYRKRRQQIADHNSSSPTHLRGLSMTAVKFGISFTTRFLNQANALVILNRDGSVQVSTGATEMGQGVNTRIGELIGTELGIDPASVKLMPTATDKNANTAPTAASSGTDLNGAAALLAARKIKFRLSDLAAQLFDQPPHFWPSKTAGLGTQPEIKVRNSPQATNDPNEGTHWPTGLATYQNIEFIQGYAVRGDLKIPIATLINEAFYSRISLSDYGFYRFDGLSFDKLKGQGDAFLYFTQGTAVSEVSVDTCTGEVKVLATDILMDLGRPINRDLDLGQITGGFVQGMGWVTNEKLHYDNQGLLLTHAPSTYKIPNVQDTPRRFNIDLLPNDENYRNVRGTKAAGEPPLLLALSVWTAIQDALGSSPSFSERPLELPATSEQILRALYPDRFTKWEHPA